MVEFIPGTVYCGYYLNEKESDDLKNLLLSMKWNEEMKARKTMSFGVAYNYSQMSYPEVPFSKELDDLRWRIHNTLFWVANNCLINLYEDGSKTMGWHSDDFSILEEKTGVAIISLGAERIIEFRKIENREEKISIKLEKGSLFFMNDEVQKVWQHRIPKSDSVEARLSLTFRKLKIK